MNKAPLLALAAMGSGCLAIKNTVCRHHAPDFSDPVAFSEGAECGGSVWENIGPFADGYEEGAEGQVHIVADKDNLDLHRAEIEFYMADVIALHLKGRSDLPKSIEAYGQEEDGGKLTIGREKEFSEGGYSCDDGTLVFSEGFYTTLLVGHCDLDGNVCTGVMWMDCPFDGEIAEETLAESCTRVIDINFSIYVADLEGDDNTKVDTGENSGFHSPLFELEVPAEQRSWPLCEHGFPIEPDPAEAWIAGI